MSVILIGLAALATTFAAELPTWFDPYLLLLAFVAMRSEVRFCIVLGALILLVRGSATLDPEWWHFLAGTAGALLILVLRRWFFASRWFNQIGMTAVLGAVVECGLVVPVRVAYPHLSFFEAVRPGLERALLTSLFAPVLCWVLDQFVLRPRFLRRGLLPSTGA